MQASASAVGDGLSFKTSHAASLEQQPPQQQHVSSSPANPPTHLSNSSSQHPLPPSVVPAQHSNPSLLMQQLPQPLSQPHSSQSLQPPQPPSQTHSLPPQSPQQPQTGGLHSHSSQPSPHSPSISQPSQRLQPPTSQPPACYRCGQPGEDGKAPCLRFIHDCCRFVRLGEGRKALCLILSVPAIRCGQSKVTGTGRCFYFYRAYHWCGRPGKNGTVFIFAGCDFA